MRRTSRLLPVLALAALGLAACGGGGDDDASTPTTGAQTATTAEAATTTTTSGRGSGSSTTAAGGGGSGSSSSDDALGQTVCDLLTKINDDLGDGADPTQYMSQFFFAAASELSVTQLGQLGSAEAGVSSRCPDELKTFLDRADLDSLRGI